jgi:hypothetical protein
MIFHRDQTRYFYEVSPDTETGMQAVKMKMPTAVYAECPKP